MSRMTDLLKELETESAVTRRLLERVPEASLAWKPHDKSMTLGTLAMHIAEAPGEIAKMLSCDTFVMQDDYVARAATSRGELLEAFETSLAEAKRVLAGFDDMRLATTWSVMKGGKVVASMSRGVGMRFVMMNHVYHHRGQLSVYLRLLNVPLPSIYGPSADENPWAAS